jgi:hypothetical protein
MMLDWNIPNDSRLWIYIPERPLTSDEEEIVNKRLSAFLEEWKAHGKDIYGFSSIVNSSLLIIAANENIESASGCSIDSQVKVIRELSIQLGIDFFNRRLAVTAETPSHILQMPVLKEMVRKGEIKPETEIFNTWSSKWGEWNANQTVRLDQSWLKGILQSALQEN